MDKETVKSFYEQDNVIEHYTRATANVGLWESEEIIFRRYFKKEDSLLELGTGAGRIALGLHDIGFRHIMATDISKGMIAEARHSGVVLEASVIFQVADACELALDSNLFEGAIFGFNGLMQIPEAKNRLRAMHEIFRVLRSGSYFVFTTHDRANPFRQHFWENEARRWSRGTQKKDLDEFGDRYENTELGDLFIHIPDREEIEEMIGMAGFELIENPIRSELAYESESVRAFSDECRFWVVRKP